MSVASSLPAAAMVSSSSSFSTCFILLLQLSIYSVSLFLYLLFSIPIPLLLYASTDNHNIMSNGVDTKHMQQQKRTKQVVR